MFFVTIIYVYLYIKWDEMNCDIGENKKRNGFTLAEVLVSVLILVILFALIVPGIFVLQRNLKQKELDTKAETIYTAVQNRLSELYTQGNMDVYDPSTHSDLKELSVIPDTYWSETDENVTQHIYYFVKNSDIANEIVDDSVLSDELDNDECGWVIEIIPKTAVEKGSSEKEELTAASVFAVYYSDDLTALNDYTNGDKITNDSFRISRDERISTYDNSPKVGYFDGSGASGSNTSSVTISNVQINSNEEINTAVVTVRRPVGLSESKLSYSFVLKDVYNNSYTMEYSNNTWINTETNQTIGNAKEFLSKETSGLNIIFTIKLDDLSKTSTRFDSLFGMNSNHTNKLVSGSDITLSAEVTCSDKRVKGDKKSASGNSIFGYEKSLSTTSDTALIQCGRHLQNLDRSSGLIVDQNKYPVKGYKEITNAIIENDISFAEDSAFYDAYQSSYFNQFVTIQKITQNGNVTEKKVPNFKSIHNSKLTTLLTKQNENQYYSIYHLSSNESGLFYEVNDLSVTGVQLVGERIYGSQSTGGLIGTVKGNVSIIDCASYLDSSKNDIPTNITSDQNLESIVWLQGNIVGGLIGDNRGSLTIQKSFVSSVLGNTNSLTGGLVGNNTGEVSIDLSYADSYLYGNVVGGLVGSNTNQLTIQNAYAAGFIGLERTENAVGAGIVNGNASITSSYTIIAAYNQAEDGGMDTDSSLIGTYLSTSTNQNASAYYLRSSTNGETYGTLLTKSTIPSNQFTKSSTNKLVPYQMMGQSLSGYEYARLKDLPHYGDWSAEFISGALVYYEQYTDGTGFEGANLTNTLKNDTTIIGDGYGILYKANEVDMPKSVTVTIGKESSIIDTNSEHYSVAVNQEEYWIYPLSKESMNPTSFIENYYERVVIEAENAETKYYDFNPHFARSVKEVSENAKLSDVPSSVSIRSPRQLYNLASYFDNGYQKYTSITYKQERDIVYCTYDWNTYTSYGTIEQQKPIGEMSRFDATYDGTCYKISDVSFVSESGNYIGLFGQVGETGKILNVVLATQYNTNHSYYMKRNKAIVQNEMIYEGVLVGRNKGTIRNCATAGYDLSGNDGTIYGYSNSKLYVGGFVGYNEGDIRNCSADQATIKLRMDNAQVYAGGFVGLNDSSGTIYNTYALTKITANATNGKTVIAGFSAFNAGSITQAYCATALTASGNGSNAYAFGSKEGNGSTKSSYYLSQGSYRFIDGLYSYGRGNSLSTDTSVHTNDSTGIPATFSRLTEMASNSNASYSLYCDITKQLSNDDAVNYPMKAVVKDSNGTLVHYGEWIVKPDLGYYGVYYWEHETGGENEGYKLTYIGFDVENKTIFEQSTLCESHDDGGVVTEYGYGYFESKELTSNASLTTNGIVLNQDAALNNEAKQQFETQMPDFTFYPYTTGDHLKIEEDNTNGTFVLSIKNAEYTFHVSPFFANALSFDQPNGFTLDSKVDEKYINTTPGLDHTKYEIRSIQQLQYINWNSHNQNTTTTVDNSTYSYTTTEQVCYWYGCYDKTVTKNDNVYKHFNYLMYTSSTATATQTKELAGHSDRANIKFLQTHDLNGTDVTNFTPIAGQSTTSSSWGYNATLYSWFGSSYDGQSYKIQELNITSDQFTVGVFGVTAGANMQNMILYSKSNAKIERLSENTSSEGAYALGGLIGIAYDYEETKGTNTITNCAIAGYQIIDNSKNKQTLGEANVGGLIGVANVQLQKCSAVVDIQINATHKDQNGNFTKATWGNFIRVGGLTGATQYQISNCYTGGNISVGEEVLNESYDSSGTNVSTTNRNGVVSLNNSTNIYISGISGSGFAMNYQNFTNSSGLKEGKPAVDHSYTYMNFPAMQGTIRSISMITSLADRFDTSNVWATDGIMIQNCYYLENSANFNIENLPKYHIGSSRNSSPASLIQDSTYQQAMLKGNAMWMTKVSQDNTSGDVVGRKYEVTSKSYTELSSSEMANTLGDAWNFVTTLENGQDISGKYSFHAGQSKLEGKNYPFPTIIQQAEETETVNVHYGEWPFDGAYWENGSDVMNLFDTLDDQGVSKKQFKIITNQDSQIEQNSISITGDSEYIEDVLPTDIVKDEDGNYLVTITAKKTGAVKIIATFGSKEASFILNITSDFMIQADKEEMQLAEGKTDTTILSATSSNTQQFLSDVQWTIEPSCDFEKDGDIDYTLLDSEDHQKALMITGHGNNATVLITATKNYNEIDYTATKRIVINKADFIGLSNQTKFNEVTIQDMIHGSDVVYTEEEKSSSTSTYFLYEKKSSSILSNSEITGKILDGSYEVEGAQVTIDATTEEGDYHTLPIDVNLNEVMDSLENPILQIQVSNQNTNYVLSVELTSSAFQLIDEDTKMLVPFTNGSTKVDIDNVPMKEGYQLEGWYEGETKVLDADGTIINGTLEETRHLVVLHAKWIEEEINTQVEN